MGCEGGGDGTGHLLRLVVGARGGAGVLRNSLGLFAVAGGGVAPRGPDEPVQGEVRGRAGVRTVGNPLGDTVTYWRGAWSGQHGNLHPNEAMQWEAMLWSKSHGYRYYDLEGIDPNIGRAIVRGEPAPKGRVHPLTSYKLGFGGKVVLFPGLYDYVPNPLLRRGYSTVLPTVEGWPRTASVVTL